MQGLRRTSSQSPPRTQPSASPTMLYLQALDGMENPLEGLSRAPTKKAVIKYKEPGQVKTNPGMSTTVAIAWVAFAVIFEVVAVTCGKHLGNALV